MALIMQHSGEASVRLRTTATHHFLMIESESVLVQKEPGERVVTKAVLKAAIWACITQITASRYNPL